jgi:ribosomal protein S18 acetylase RimI-like enzyme
MNNELIVRLLDFEDEIPWNLLLTADPSVEHIKQYLNEGLCFLAFLNQQLIGVFVLVETIPDTYELMNIAVDEKFQGRGFGKRLVHRAKLEVRQRGASVLNVGTGNSSLSQLAFYQKCGFRIVGVESDFFTKNYEEEIIENGIRCVDMIRLSLKL